MATVDRPLVFLLDALDQLSLDHRAHLLAWLPNKLPPNVFFIVSTVTDHPTFDVLSMVSVAAEGGAGRSGFLEVPALGRSLALSLVREWLKSAGRGLTSSQLTIVGDAFTACSLPLYITLVFDEVDLCSVTSGGASTQQLQTRALVYSQRLCSFSRCPRDDQSAT